MNILFLHYLSVSFFILYIFIDRIFIRIFMKKELRESFYKKIKIYILLISFLTIVSGLLLVLKHNLSFLIFLKIFFAYFFIGSFFYCPFFMKKTDKEVGKVIYRYLVVFFLIMTVILGLYI